MLTPLSIVSLDQGRQNAGDEDAYYGRAGAELPLALLPGRLGRLVRRLRGAVADADQAAGAKASAAR